MTERSPVTVADPPPPTFVADYQELYIDRRLSAAEVALHMAKLYGRHMYAERVLRWARVLELPVRQRYEKKEGTRAAERAVRTAARTTVTLSDVRRAEASGEIVRSAPRQEEPLEVPFGFPEIAEAAAVAPPAVGSYLFVELGSSSCRWCTSPKVTAVRDFRFCGAPAEHGRPYCEEHQARAFRAPTPGEAKLIKKAPR